MPLSPPAPRKQIHRRTVVCEGFLRDDGLWDIEGQIVDVKGYAFPNHDKGEIPVGEPLHGMRVRLTMDDEFLIHAAEAVTDHSPSRICPNIPQGFEQLVGLKIAPGWRRQTQRLLGGLNGCTHMVDLLVPIATTAFQTIYPWKNGRERRGEGAWADKTRPRVLDSCHALASDGEIAKYRWPQFYTGE
ncbi:MAG: DUF2889 domain-containing protein [Sedimenticola sp.]